MWSIQAFKLSLDLYPSLRITPVKARITYFAMPARGGKSKQPWKGKAVKQGDTLQTVIVLENGNTPENANVGMPARKKSTKKNNPNITQQSSANTASSLPVNVQPRGDSQPLDDPFLSPPACVMPTVPRHSPAEFSPRSTSPSSEIDINDISDTSSVDSPAPLPTRPRHAQHSTHNSQPDSLRPVDRRSRSNSPRAGPHSKDKPIPNPRTTKASKKDKDKEAQDVRTFFRVQNERQFCIFCDSVRVTTPSHRIKDYSINTSTSVLRAHFVKAHLHEWVDGCDKLKIAINENFELKNPSINKYRADRDGRSHPQAAKSKEFEHEIPEYSREAFADAITDFIVADDQSIRVIDSPYLRRIFLLLRQELRDSDIPHRTSIKEHILKRLDKHFETLRNEMQESLGKISFTMDLWSDPNLVPYMASTAHWIHATQVTRMGRLEYNLELRTDLIGFQCVPGRHTGEHLATAFICMVERLKIIPKIGWITMDNATNNDKFCEVLSRELRAVIGPNRVQVKFDKFKR
ncbi:hypothetical protein D9613_012719 [Agrocybe pediades]|uniref:Transposase n=1 Tax=Agrocybe pediades TaxID=84607 RepID=A0A8H4QK32_9AGAR|nr:hypothetical protein D9613_012719 [Agrocybe pediades]